MTPEEINDLLVRMAKGEVSAVGFWRLVERIVPHYPGLPVNTNDCWKIKAAYLAVEFDAPVQCAVRYAVCGEASICGLR